MSATVMSPALRASVYPPPGYLRVDSTSSWRRSFAKQLFSRYDSEICLTLADGSQRDGAVVLAQGQINHGGDRKTAFVVIASQALCLGSRRVRFRKQGAPKTRAPPRPLQRHVAKWHPEALS